MKRKFKKQHTRDNKIKLGLNIIFMIFATVLLSVEAESINLKDLCYVFWENFSIKNFLFYCGIESSIRYLFYIVTLSNREGILIDSLSFIGFFRSISTWVQSRKIFA